MKKTKKKLIVFLVVFLICAGLLTFFAIYYRPMPLAIYSESTDFRIWRANAEPIFFEEVSDLVDLEQVLEILSRYTFLRISYDLGPVIVLPDMLWQISFWRRPSERVVITLGYSGSHLNRRTTGVFSSMYRIQLHRIQNVELLIYEINALFES